MPRTRQQQSTARSALTPLGRALHSIRPVSAAHALFDMARRPSRACLVLDSPLLARTHRQVPSRTVDWPQRTHHTASESLCARAPLRPPPLALLLSRHLPALVGASYVRIGAAMPARPRAQRSGRRPGPHQARDAAWPARNRPSGDRITPGAAHTPRPSGQPRRTRSVVAHAISIVTGWRACAGAPGRRRRGYPAALCRPPASARARGSRRDRT